MVTALGADGKHDHILTEWDDLHDSRQGGVEVLPGQSVAFFVDESDANRDRLSNIISAGFKETHNRWADCGCALWDRRLAYSATEQVGIAVVIRFDTDCEKRSKQFHGRPFLDDESRRNQYGRGELAH